MTSEKRAEEYESGACRHLAKSIQLQGTKIVKNPKAGASCSRNSNQGSGLGQREQKGVRVGVVQ